MKNSKSDLIGNDSEAGFLTSLICDIAYITVHTYRGHELIMSIYLLNVSWGVS